MATGVASESNVAASFLSLADLGPINLQWIGRKTHSAIMIAIGSDSAITIAIEFKTAIKIAIALVKNKH